MKRYYYLDANNQQQGPVYADALHALGVSATTLVWCEGMAQWTPAGKVAELSPYIPRQALPECRPYRLQE